MPTGRSRSWRWPTENSPSWACESSASASVRPTAAVPMAWHSSSQGPPPLRRLATSGRTTRSSRCSHASRCPGLATAMDRRRRRHRCSWIRRWRRRRSRIHARQRSARRVVSSPPKWRRSFRSSARRSTRRSSSCCPARRRRRVATVSALCRPAARSSSSKRSSARRAAVAARLYRPIGPGAAQHLAEAFFQSEDRNRFVHAWLSLAPHEPAQVAGARRRAAAHNSEMKTKW
mmetsp:Transcript_93653/g.280896  ORF Transcript_93653/g.280896 Transcript_93653/m.280896 type:complete len:232 (-) Transcript_93653:17-712(-)